MISRAAALITWPSITPIFILLTVTLYTAYPFLAGNTADVPGEDAEFLARLVFNKTWEPYRYYGQYLYLLFNPQLYYYLTPVFSMIPAVFLRLERWFIVWLVVLLGGFGYTRHMLMGSFLPVINYMVFIPLNLFLLGKGHYRWLIVSMFVSLMFHGSSGVIIQAGTLLCMLCRFKWRDWIYVLPFGVPVVTIYAINHQLAPSIAAQVLTNLQGDNPTYANYLAVIRSNSILSKTDLFNYLPANWYFYYLGLPLLPALAVLAAERIIWQRLFCFTVFPIGIIVGWFAMPGLQPYTFDILDRASSALSIIIFMATGLAFSNLLLRRRDAY